MLLIRIAKIAAPKADPACEIRPMSTPVRMPCAKRPGFVVQEHTGSAARKRIAQPIAPESRLTDGSLHCAQTMRAIVQ